LTNGICLWDFSRLEIRQSTFFWAQCLKRRESKPRNPRKSAFSKLAQMPTELGLCFALGPFSSSQCRNLSLWPGIGQMRPINSCFRTILRITTWGRIRGTPSHKWSNRVPIRKSKSRMSIRNLSNAKKSAKSRKNTVKT